MSYRLIYSKQAEKDLKKVRSAGLAEKVKKLFAILEENPYQNPPPYEKLVGNLSGFISRRINIQHRLVYGVKEQEKQVKILRAWSHYE